MLAWLHGARPDPCALCLAAAGADFDDLPRSPEILHGQFNTSWVLLICLGKYLIMGFNFSIAGKLVKVALGLRDRSYLKGLSL